MWTKWAFGNATTIVATVLTIASVFPRNFSTTVAARNHKKSASHSVLPRFDETDAAADNLQNGSASLPAISGPATVKLDSSPTEIQDKEGAAATTATNVAEPVVIFDLDSSKKALLTIYAKCMRDLVPDKSADDGTAGIRESIEALYVIVSGAANRLGVLKQTVLDKTEIRHMDEVLAVFYADSIVLLRKTSECLAKSWAADDKSLNAGFEQLIRKYGGLIGTLGKDLCELQKAKHYFYIAQSLGMLWVTRVAFFQLFKQDMAVTPEGISSATGVIDHATQHLVSDVFNSKAVANTDGAYIRKQKFLAESNPYGQLKLTVDLFKASWVLVTSRVSFHKRFGLLAAGMIDHIGVGLAQNRTLPEVHYWATISMATAIADRIYKEGPVLYRIAGYMGPFLSVSKDGKGDDAKGISQIAVIYHQVTGMYERAMVLLDEGASGLDRSSMLLADVLFSAVLNVKLGVRLISNNITALFRPQVEAILLHACQQMMLAKDLDPSYVLNEMQYNDRVQASISLLMALSSRSQALEGAVDFQPIYDQLLAPLIEFFQKQYETCAKHKPDIPDELMKKKGDVVLFYLALINMHIVGITTQDDIGPYVNGLKDGVTAGIERAQAALEKALNQPK